MTISSATDDGQDALTCELRRIRRLTPPEVPLPATRATMGDDAVLLVDVAEAAGWPGWRCAGAEHLAGPLDIVRRDDGHEILLVDLAETCAHACGVRESSEAGWHRGEAVTLVVSVMRGVVEASARGLADDVPGSWWLTHDRRPVFVACGDARDGAPIGAASRALVRRIAAACEDRVVSRACDDILVALERPGGLEREIERLEQSLFEAAAPQPIPLEPSPSTRRGPREPRVIRIDDVDSGGTAARVRKALEALVDARIARGVATATESLGRVFRRRDRRRADPAGASDGTSPRARGRVLLVAGVVGLIVIAVGVLWPVEDAGRADDRGDGGQDAVEGPPPTPEATPAASSDREQDAVADADDPVRAARALLADEEAGSARRLGADPEVTLVDDYGAVALLSVRADEGPRRLLVVERVDGTWRVRDLYREGDE